MTAPPAYSVAQTFPAAPRGRFQFDRHYLLYASSGSMRLDAEGTAWSLPPARAALIRADEPIDVTITTTIACRSVLFAPEIYPAPDAGVSVFDVSPLARELILECAQWGPETDGQSGYATSLFQALANVAWQAASNPLRLSMPLARSDTVRRAIELTEAGLTEDLGFADLARQLATSERSLARHFSDELGMTWRQAQQRLRVIRAVEALAASDRPVTDIAFSLGYNSMSAFNAAFRALTGKTPSEYRASFRPAE
ncbi:helix-turn-helix domain-containing protein [Oricola sp.]|uniref:helix-turn-helix domain-containing protein n=1 Tax=Oricola sp. TaxID=1979950 RepID=UPI003BA9C7D4